MHSLGYTDTELVSGCLRGVSRNSGRYFDMFRGRVMFPIIDTLNRVVARRAHNGQRGAEISQLLRYGHI